MNITQLLLATFLLSTICATSLSDTRNNGGDAKNDRDDNKPDKPKQPGQPTNPDHKHGEKQSCGGASNVQCPEGFTCTTTEQCTDLTTCEGICAPPQKPEKPEKPEKPDHREPASCGGSNNVQCPTDHTCVTTATCTDLTTCEGVCTRPKPTTKKATAQAEDEQTAGKATDKPQLAGSDIKDDRRNSPRQGEKRGTEHPSHDNDNENRLPHEGEHHEERENEERVREHENKDADLPAHEERNADDKPQSDETERHGPHHGHEGTENQDGSRDNRERSHGSEQRDGKEQMGDEEKQQEREPIRKPNADGKPQLGDHDATDQPNTREERDADHPSHDNKHGKPHGGENVRQGGGEYKRKRNDDDDDTVMRTKEHEKHSGHHHHGRHRWIVKVGVLISALVIGFALVTIFVKRNRNGDYQAIKYCTQEQLAKANPCYV